MTARGLPERAPNWSFSVGDFPLLVSTVTHAHLSYMPQLQLCITAILSTAVLYCWNSYFQLRRFSCKHIPETFIHRECALYLVLISQRCLTRAGSFLNFWNTAPNSQLMQTCSQSMSDIISQPAELMWELINSHSRFLHSYLGLSVRRCDMWVSGERHGWFVMSSHAISRWQPLRAASISALIPAKPADQHS